MSWRHNEPKHLQPWHWPISPADIPVLTPTGVKFSSFWPKSTQVLVLPTGSYAPVIFVALNTKPHNVPVFGHIIQANDNIYTAMMHSGGQFTNGLWDCHCAILWNCFIWKLMILSYTRFFFFFFLLLFRWSTCHVTTEKARYPTGYY